MSCRCGSGGFAIQGFSWVILERNPWPGLCLFKCLRCGAKWRARRRYSDKLPNHKERSRSGMSDEDILDRIRQAELDVDLKTGDVFTVRTGGFCKPLKVIVRNPPRDNGKGWRGAYRFVEICANGLKKKIAVHRLVWMFANGQTVPEGFDVDHIEGKSARHPDAISNLRILESSRNRGRGYTGTGRSLFTESEPARVPF